MNGDRCARGQASGRLVGGEGWTLGTALEPAKERAADIGAPALALAPISLAWSVILTYPRQHLIGEARGSLADRLPSLLANRKWRLAATRA